jgi:HK97 family phage major capsid protein
MAQISRADAAALISEQKATDVLTSKDFQSVVLSAFPQVQMSKKTHNTPVLSTAPTAGFVTEATDSTGVKPSSTTAWTNKSLVAEELAFIVPVHENVLADSDIDLWAAIQPEVAKAFGLALDKAVLFGTNAPASWTDANLVAKAIAASQNVEHAGTADQDLAEDINQVLAKLEVDNWNPTHTFAIRGLKSQLRGLRDENGSPIYYSNLVGSGQGADSIYGVDLSYLDARVASPSVAELIAVDADAYRVGIRDDIEVTVSRDATVDGINLFERDMVGFRFRVRIAFGKVASQVGHGSSVPVSVLQPNAG